MLPAPRLDDPALEAFANRVMCRLATNCADTPVLLLDSPQPQAELLPDGRVTVRLGLARELFDEAELAFVLAHELAHRELEHRAPRHIAARLPLELQADAWALERITARGYREDAGTTLLLRMLPPPTARDGDTAERSVEARRQILARLAALPRPQAAQPMDAGTGVTRPSDAASALAALLQRYRQDEDAQPR